MTIFIFVVLIFLVIRFSVTVFNFISNPKLPGTINHYYDIVSILIPVRDEAPTILTLLHSIKEQDYPNYEVLVLDDGSSDDTFDRVQAFCSTNPSFKIIKGKQLPVNWLGKNYACHQLGKMAIGKYLLFVDANTILQKGLINSLINRVKTYKLTLLSLYPNQEMQNFGEKITVPLIHFILLNLLPLRLVKLAKSSAFSAASGQCMFFDAANYKENYWHKQVKNQLAEDLQIIKLIKQEKFRAETLLGNGMIFCKMDQKLNEIIRSFSKNLLPGFGSNTIILLIYLLLVIIGPIIIALNFNVNLLVLPVTLIVLSRIMISYLSGQKVLVNVILHPLQMLFFLIISLNAIKNHILKKGTWKGRKIKTI